MSERYADGFENVGTNAKRLRRILIDDELDALDVTDALLAPKASPTFTGTVTLPATVVLNGVTLLPTGTELNYVDGVTSALQTQLNAKAATGATVIAPIANDASGTVIATAVNGIITALIAAGILAIA